MSLNVKDPEAHRLASAIAAETGQSITRVVLEALQEQYERLQRRKGRATLQELSALAQRISAHRPAGGYLDHGELLYDDDGLPR